MADQPRHPGSAEAEKRESRPPAPILIKTVATEAVAPPEQSPTTPLTPEEQMALFEKELKETDWGHQPC